MGSHKMSTIPPDVEPALGVYSIRWYILLIFSLLNMFQCTIWNTWGPVEKVAKVVFASWSNQTISLFANWANFVSFPFLIPSMYLAEKSLRGCVVWAAGFMVLGSISRCVAIVTNVPDVIFTITCHLSAVLNGLAGVLLCSIPPAISAAWFPPNERVTATSIGQTLNCFGGGLVYLIAGLVVKTSNNGGSEHGNNCKTDNVTEPSLIFTSDSEIYRTELSYYLYTLAGPPFLLFILTLVYFPAKPLRPPSTTSQLKKTVALSGFISLLKNPQAWLILLVNTISSGVPGTWMAMMVTNLTKVKAEGQCLSEEWINILALVSRLSMMTFSIFLARLTDILRGHMKLTIMVQLGCATVVYTFLSLVTIGVLEPPSFLGLEAAVFCLLVLGNCLARSNASLLQELLVEVTFPVSEIVCGAWFVLGFSTISMLFLFIFLIPDVGTNWLNYVLPVSSLVCMPLMFMVKEGYNRGKLDRKV